MLSNIVQAQTSTQRQLAVSSVAAAGVSVARMAQPPLSAVIGHRVPGVVQAVTILWGLMLIPTGLAMVLGLMAIPFHDHTFDIPCSIGAALFACVVWFGLHLNARTPLAWKIQVVLSIVGLCCFPFGTIVNTLIIAAWFNPETKAWFGVDPPPAKVVHP